MDGPRCAHVQPLCVGGQKDLSVQFKSNNLMFAYDIQNISNRHGGDGGFSPEKILKNKCFLVTSGATSCM